MLSRGAEREGRSMVGKGRETRDQENPPWWYDVITTAMRTPVLDQQRTIYTNRTLRYERIGAVGFDFDHTLAVYNTKALDELAMGLVTEHLVKEEKMPAAWFDDIPDPSFARKGLILDVELGNILKTDRYGHVLHAYHGSHKLTVSEKRRSYGELDVIPHGTSGGRYLQVDHAFSKPEILLYSGLIEKMKSEERRGLWRRIRKYTDLVHRDGSLKSVITADPGKFLEIDPLTEQLLLHLRSIGKKTFLLTNSEWEYTSKMIKPVLGRPDSSGLDWLDLFDLVVVEARKPTYFSPNGMSSEGKQGPHEKVIRGGAIPDLEKRLEVAGPQVLYVGDHIYSDLISSKRHTYWRTMLVLPELEEELLVQSALPGTVSQLKQTDDRRTTTEREVTHWKTMERSLQGIEAPENRALLRRLRGECAENRKKAVMTLKEHIRQRESLRARLSKATNIYWGSLFRAGSELTYYGRQLEDYACTYTSRATNLCFYPPKHYFRSAMDYLPHELESM